MMRMSKMMKKMMDKNITESRITLTHFSACKSKVKVNCSCLHHQMFLNGELMSRRVASYSKNKFIN